MTTTRVIYTWADGDNRPAKSWVSAAAGDWSGDYDLEAMEDELLAEVQARLPEGCTIHRNGDVIGPVGVDSDSIDIKSILGEIKVWPLFERHDITSFYVVECVGTVREWYSVKGTSPEDAMKNFDEGTLINSESDAMPVSVRPAED